MYVLCMRCCVLCTCGGYLLATVVGWRECSRACARFFSESAVRVCALRRVRAAACASLRWLASYRFMWSVRVNMHSLVRPCVFQFGIVYVRKCCHSVWWLNKLTGALAPTATNPTLPVGRWFVSDWCTLDGCNDERLVKQHTYYFEYIMNVSTNIYLGCLKRVRFYFVINSNLLN